MSALFHLISIYLRDLLGEKRTDHRQERSPESPIDTHIEPNPPEGDLDIGRAIVAFEGRRDENGHLSIYRLPANDGGGTEEIAGINSKYHPEELARLKALSPAQREAEAARYIQDYSRKHTGISKDSSLRKGTLFFVLDTTFHRGGGGSAWVVQTALRSLGYSILRDRIWGEKTRRALRSADERFPHQILDRFRTARESYERDVVGYRANFWKGFVNRWDRVRELSAEWNAADEPYPDVPSPLPSTGESPLEETIRLPREGTSTLNHFYGIANPAGRDLTWFSFPTDRVHLYSRTGSQLTDRTGNGLDDHRCHRLIKDRLEAALRNIYETLGQTRFEAEGWHVYGGCFNYRKKRGGSSLSTHSWGIAIDINPGENPFQGRSTTFSDVAIDIMERHGFLSGGRAWGKDWMHFQAAIPRISPGSYYDRNGLPKFIEAAS